jgi:hypothetical protein
MRRKSMAHSAIAGRGKGVCRAGRCHAGLAIGTQREPDWAKAEAEGGGARKAAAKDDQVATSLFEVQVRHLIA